MAAPESNEDDTVSWRKAAFAVGAAALVFVGTTAYLSAHEKIHSANVGLAVVSLISGGFSLFVKKPVIRFLVLIPGMVIGRKIVLSQSPGYSDSIWVELAVYLLPFLAVHSIYNRSNRVG